MKINIKRNKSFTYILPLFNIYVEIKYFHLLVNTYLWTDDVTEDCLCLLFKFDGNVTGQFQAREGFTMYEKRLRNSEYYIDEEDHGEYVLYKFRLEDELIEEKHKFIAGKYSKLKEENKTTIIKFCKAKYNIATANAIKDVLNRAPKLRERLSEEIKHYIPEDAELSSIINIDDETFNKHIEKQDK